MSFQPAANKAAEKVITKLGHSITYTYNAGGTVDTYVVLAKSNEPAGSNAGIQVNESVWEADLLAQDVTPTRGDTFVVDGTTYTVTAIVREDRQIVRVMVKS